jgi:hypothetical protein
VGKEVSDSDAVVIIPRVVRIEGRCHSKHYIVLDHLEPAYQAGDVLARIPRRCRLAWWMTEWEHDAHLT